MLPKTMLFACVLLITSFGTSTTYAQCNRAGGGGGMGGGGMGGAANSFSPVNSMAGFVPNARTTTAQAFGANAAMYRDRTRERLDAQVSAMYSTMAARRAAGAAANQQRFAHIRQMRALYAASTDRVSRRQILIARLRERDAQRRPVRNGVNLRKSVRTQLAAR